ncbi:MAG: aldo/keto reductase [Oscillospiraceae bacterium]|jgi:predicted aldo/keto reductase-like oxidoreductase|nr:aldo/keto reductase [Oscillospiraceae bacterium]
MSEQPKTTQVQTRADPLTGQPLSALGFGCMRFPRALTGGIDAAKTSRLIIEAVERGVNYFDTAYVYGGSEESLGGILEKHGLRARINLATKLPVFACQKTEDFERIFSEQLRRLRTDHIDYYLIHNLGAVGSWERLRGLGVERWIADKKASGQIGRIGFSFHGSKASFMKLLDVYPWEFVQIQYNYLNPMDQAGVDGLRAIAAKGLAAIIMEPLLGGKLANPSKKAAAAFAESARPDWTPAEWAMRWLLNQPEVTVILSGMNAMDQLHGNIRSTQGAEPGHLTEADMDVFGKARAAFAESNRVGCTGCGYCMPCPRGVNIPGCFTAYNMSYGASYIDGLKNYLTTVGISDPDHYAGARRCVNCGVCVKKCPQSIAIPSELRRVKRRLDFPFLMPAVRLAFRRPGGKRRGERAAG